MHDRDCVARKIYISLSYCLYNYLKNQNRKWMNHIVLFMIVVVVVGGGGGGVIVVVVK